MDNFLPSIVERMSNKLLPPHRYVVEQGQEKTEDSEFFYVGKSFCTVKVRDAKGKEVLIGRLDEGEHFGEIQIIYNSPRTASVISMNYNTFGTMNWNGYKRLI